MHRPHRITPAVLIGAACLCSSLAIATQHEHEHEYRQHGSHVHGVAELAIAAEGESVLVELDSPAANILGFEHAPSNPEQEQTLHHAVEHLRDAQHMLRFNPQSRCRLVEVDLDSPLLPADAMHEQQAGHEHEQAGEHHDEAGHADFTVSYRFHCADMSSLEHLHVGLFDAFPGMQNIQAQFAIGGHQGAVELTPANPMLRF